MSPVTGNDLITTIRVRTNNSRCKNPKFSNTLSCFQHFLIIYHPEGMSFKGV